MTGSYVILGHGFNPCFKSSLAKIAELEHHYYISGTNKGYHSQYLSFLFQSHMFPKQVRKPVLIINFLVEIYKLNLYEFIWVTFCAMFRKKVTFCLNKHAGFIQNKHQCISHGKNIPNETKYHATFPSAVGTVTVLRMIGKKHCQIKQT